MVYPASLEDIEIVEIQVAQYLMGGVEVTQGAWQKLGDAISLEKHRPGIKFPWVDLEAKLQGLRPGKVYVVAGRPAMGKSTVAHNLARSFAKDSKTVVLVSLEDSPEGIAD